MKNGKEKPTTKRKDNSVGTAVNKKERLKAKAAMPKALAVESQRAAAGWVWLKLDKTTKQVHPSKVEALKAEGWR